MKFKLNKNICILVGALLILGIIGIIMWLGFGKKEKYNMTKDNQAPALMQAPDVPIDTQQLEGGFNMPLGAQMSHGMNQELEMSESTAMQSGHQYPPMTKQQFEYNRGIGQMPHDIRSQMEKQYGGESAAGGGYDMMNRMSNPNPATNSVGVGQGLGNGGGGNHLTASYEYL